MPDLQLKGLSGVAIRRPVFTTMAMLLLVTLGIFSYRKLPIDQYPDVSIPMVMVRSAYPGASAETVEREVTRKMEEAFNPVRGVKRVTSTSLEGVSQVVVEFNLGRSVDIAAADIRAKIDGIRPTLPQDLKQPVVQTLDPSAEPILSLALNSSSLSSVALTMLADETIARRLESVTGVGEVRISGGTARQVKVYIQPPRMEALGITMPEVMAALRQQNLEVPAGRLERGIGERLVRVTGRITDPKQFGQVIVSTRSGHPVRLSDVARVEEGAEEVRSVATVNGERAIGVDILKVSGGNTVDVADGVNAAVVKLNAELPKGTTLSVVRDNSVMIRNSVNDVIHELLIGALLTVLIVMLFLNDWKATSITALALPVSVISAFILIGALGFTINVLTLMALSLSIGILIDDAIVVVENIVRHREQGEDHFTAAAWGTTEIILAVLATTFSIVAVFVPVAFMGGIIGRFFFQFGLTVAWAVLVSLIVSFTMTPMLSAWWGVNPHDRASHEGNAITRALAAFNRGFDRVGERYRGIISWALGHRILTLSIATGVFLLSMLLAGRVGGGFMPESDSSEFVILFETPEGSSLSYTAAKATEMEKGLRARPEVTLVYTTIGSGATGKVSGGQMYVKLVPSHDRKLTQAQMILEARKVVKQYFGVRTQTLVAGGMGGPKAPLAVEVRGPDIAVLKRLSETLLSRIEAIPGIVDTRSSLGDPKPELRINLDRDVANRVGLDVAQVSNSVRPLLAGEVATRWEDPTGEERDVFVQLAPELRQSVEDVAALPMPTLGRGASGTATIALRDVAKLDLGAAPATIDRKALQRIVTIGASTAPGLSISGASALIQAQVDSTTLPPGYSVALGGETEMMVETVGYVVESIVLAIVLIFLILASQFESFTQPFAIMLSLPLSIIGVVLGLYLTGSTFNMMSMIGIIMLMGLVTKNAILLVDNTNAKRHHGMDRHTALIEAGAVRLRPIMMTTLAMIFGMLPIALALGEGGGFRAPMARAVIGGLITSTMLTLVVVPVAYTYFDDFGAFMKRLFVTTDREAEITREREIAGLVE